MFTNLRKIGMDKRIMELLYQPTSNKNFVTQIPMKPKKNMKAKLFQNKVCSNLTNSLATKLKEKELSLYLELSKKRMLIHVLLHL